jgi:integrase
MSARRSTRGGGSVYRHDSRDLWVGQVTLGGKRRRVYGATKGEARQKLNTLLGAGTEAVRRRVTVGALLDTWLHRDVAGKGLAPATLENHRRCVETWTAAVGHIEASRLTVRDVEAVLDVRGGARGSLIKLRNVLSQALDAGMRRGDVTRNVATLAVLPADAPGPVRRTALRPDEARALLDVLTQERNGALYAVSLLCGLRPGEAAGLLWDDVDLDAGTLTVAHAVRLEGGRPVVTEALKTRRARRTLAMPATLTAMLSDHRRSQAAERLAARRWDDPRLVFASANGTPLHPSNVRRELSLLCERAGLPVVSPNELRHSCASLLSDQGVPLEQIADALGHTTTRMLEATYRHRLRRVIDVTAEVRWA